MDSKEKARIRIEHWLKHNQSHLREYESFAHELTATGEDESASNIRQMVALTAKSNEYLQMALKSLS